MNDTDIKRFKKWIKEQSYQPLVTGSEKAADGIRIFIKIPRCEDFDYLYIQNYYYKTNSLIRENNLRYLGMYCHLDGLIYDSNGFFYKSIPQLEAKKNISVMQREAENAVREKVEKWIDNDRTHLEIKELNTEKATAALDDYKKHCAANIARKLFINGADNSVVPFRCEYTLKCWNDDDLLDYIRDPNSYIDAAAQKYINEHQEDMLLQILQNDNVSSHLQQLLDNPENVVHRIRAISDAVRESNAKTVNVTINKDDTEFTFKIEAEQLIGDHNYYSLWYIPAVDRRQFENLFGRSAYILPEDIIKITYNRSVLYECEPFETEQADACSLGMTM